MNYKEIFWEILISVGTVVTLLGSGFMIIYGISNLFIGS